MNTEFLVFALLWIYGHVTRTECRRRGLSSPRRLADDRCQPCDVTKCPDVSTQWCPGGVLVRDRCNCCPRCRIRSPLEGLVTSTTSTTTAAMMTSLNEQSEACAKISCPKFQVCMLNIQGIPLCRCPTKFWCMKGDRSPVCGHDDVTYKSKCFLKMAECEANKSIGIKRRGKCLKSDRDRQLKAERLKEKQMKNEQKAEKRKLKREKLQRRLRKYVKRERRQRKKEKRRRTKNHNNKHYRM